MTCLVDVLIACFNKFYLIICFAWKFWWWKLFVLKTSSLFLENNVAHIGVVGVMLNLMEQNHIWEVEPEGSLVCSQQAATGPYLESDEWIESTSSHPISFKSHCSIIILSMPASFKWPFPFIFSEYNSVIIFYLYCASYMSHCCILLDLITLIFLVKSIIHKAAYEIFSSLLLIHLS